MPTTCGTATDRRLLQLGLLMIILTMLAAAFACTSDDEALHIERGSAHLGAGEYDQAISAFEEAIRVNLKSAEAYNGRGFASYNKGEYDSAIADYNTAIGIYPEFAKAYDNRGYTRYNKGEYDSAIKDLDVAVRLDPESAIAYENRGNTYTPATGNTIGRLPITTLPFVSTSDTQKPITTGGWPTTTRQIMREPSRITTLPSA